MRKIDTIVIHHTVIPQDHDSLGTMATIRQAHKKNGLSPDGLIAYHHVIGNHWARNGRPTETIGYHAGNWDINKRSLAVALNGNFNNDHLTLYQKDKLGWILSHWMKEFNIARESILLHKEIKATACAGANITQGTIDMVLSSQDMNTCETKLDAAKKFDVEERVPQIKRLQDEVKKLTGMVIAGNGREKNLEAEVLEKDGRITVAKTETARKEDLIVAKEKELFELRGSLDDAEQTAEDNDDRIREEAAETATDELKQNILSNFWAWLTGKR